MALFAVKEEQLGDLIPAYAFIWPEVGGIFLTPGNTANKCKINRHLCL